MTSARTAIPAWNSAGWLPPVQPGESGSSAARSPYPVDLLDVIERFATSPERVKILDGLLRFRVDLHRAGIVTGFQWLDGSFLEQVEVLEQRPPRDLDVVNFLDLSKVDQSALALQHSALFHHGQVKKTYALDAYTIQIGGILDGESVKTISYWYSMWSHRRGGQWKGFLQVNLNTKQDSFARELLNSKGSIDHD